jgi:hypothetical protein
MGITNVNMMIDFIIDTIRDGYKIPFHSVPPYVCFSNNLSAMKHTDQFPAFVWVAGLLLTNGQLALQCLTDPQA